MAAAQRQAGDPRHAGLTRERVVETALELVRADGVEALTMRHLAAKLGVAATAIYWHVGDKQALLDAVVDRISSRFGEMPVQGDDPVARTVSIGATLRRNLLHDPNLVGLVHASGHTAGMFQPARRALVRELTDAGLAPDDVALGVQLVLRHVSGSVLNDVQMERSPESYDDPSPCWVPDDIANGPAVLAAMAEPADTYHLFEYALAALVRSVITGAHESEVRTT